MVGFKKRKDSMKVQWYKRLICCLFAVILFASGMCVGIENSHSYLACESTEQSEDSQYKNSQTLISSIYCSNESLQRNNAQEIKNNFKRNILRKTRSTILTSIPWITKQKLFYFEEHLLMDVPYSTFSQIVIIEYIHRQDGAK